MDQSRSLTYKIAFTGASSTGKTTLAKALMARDEFTGVIPNYIHINANSLATELNLPTFNQQSIEQRRYFRHTYFKKKLALENDQASFITDRSFIDIASYWVLSDNLMRPSHWRFLLDPCKNLSNNYDIHFLFPLGRTPFTLDPKRSPSPLFHLASERLIRFYLSQWRIDFIEIVSDTIDKRVDEILKWVNHKNTTK